MTINDRKPRLLNKRKILCEKSNLVHTKKDSFLLKNKWTVDDSSIAKKKNKKNLRSEKNSGKHGVQHDNRP